jgi:predicted Zn finger-like uncharacterized protein
MLTQCPSCQTTFRVTSEILRVAYGQVRCGRCQTQFDATERLIEETDDGITESGRYMRQPRQMQPPPPQPGQIDVEEPIQHEDITLEGRHIEISGVYPAIDETGSGEPQVREEIVEEWVEIDEEEATVDVAPDEVIDAYAEVSYEQQDDDESADAEVTYEDDAVSYEDEDEDMRRAAEELEAENRARQAQQQRQWSAPAPARNFTSTRSRSSRRDQAQAADEANEFDISAPRPRREQAARIWSMLVAPLLLLLLVQVIHNYRATLARHPTVGAPLQSIYSTLGLTLRPDWNLHAYEVQQWGVVSDPATPGTLKVRASVKNLADFAQPYPLLKLVLEDRWGEQVRAREFEPSEYLDPTIASDRFLAPSQQTGATIAIVDPGPDAEGFRFDVCLRGARGPVCAADVPGTK